MCAEEDSIGDLSIFVQVLVDVMTFAYFYPRNDIMFKTASLTDVETLRKTWAQWNAMNWVRSLIMLIGLGFSCLALHKIYSMD